MCSHHQAHEGGLYSTKLSFLSEQNIFATIMMLWMLICVCSRLYSLLLIGTCCLLLQRSESFLLIPTTTTIRSARHHTPVIQHNHGYYYYFDNVKFSSNRYYSVRRGGAGSTTILLSSQQQQNTIEEKEKSTTKTRQKLRTWEESFQLLVSYKEQHGNCNVPQRYKDDPSLGNWVNNQRSGKDKLSDDRIVKLDDLGFLWSNELYEEQWDEMFEKLVLYAKENDGDCNIPENDDDNDKNKELYSWVRKQRLRKSLLSKERRTKLDNIGLIWEDANKVKCDQKWNGMYERLQEYKLKYRHCRVPYKWEEDPTLGTWVFTQRQNYRKGLLREDRQMRLEEMDFTWKVRNGNSPDYVMLDSKWFVKFGILHNFLEEHGHCDVPKRYKKDKSLGLWVSYQRMNQKNGSLPQDRKELLDDIGFTWSFNDQKDEQWNEKYQELKTFKDTNGHLRLPETSAILSDWAYRQRVLFTRGRLRVERKVLLDEIEFRWEIQNSSS